jgi:hypothetical protein
VTAAPCDNNTPNRLPATSAPLAGPLVDTEVRQKISGAPFNIDIVAETRALKRNGAMEDFLYGAMQASSGSASKATGLRQRVNPRFE